MLLLAGVFGHEEAELVKGRRLGQCQFRQLEEGLVVAPEELGGRPSDPGLVAQPVRDRAHRVGSEPGRVAHLKFSEKKIM